MHDSLLSTLNKTYPSGSISTKGENLRQLTDDQSIFMPPLRLDNSQPLLGPIVVPTCRNILRNRKNISRIMELAQEEGSNFVIILCSGKAKKEDVATIARAYPGLQLLAIDGPFYDTDVQSRFETASSIIAAGRGNDLAEKRNFALRLGKAMRWQSLMLLDDDIQLSSEDLRKTAVLLKTGASLVGFNVRKFSDHSSVIYAGDWVNNPVDSFIGAGILAVNLTTPTLPLFPHIYNEDWLFLLTQSLLSDVDLVWAGSVRQDYRHPFRNKYRAEHEEIGDVLAESLMQLAMTAKNSPIAHTKQDLFAHVIAQANEAFWENEINNRLLYLRDTRLKTLAKKWHPIKRRQVLRLLDRAQAILVGYEGIGGIRASDLAAWVTMWQRDISVWQAMTAHSKTYDNVVEALHAIGGKNAYIYKNSSTPQQTKVPASATSQAYRTVQLERISGLLKRMHPMLPAAAAAGNAITKIMQDYLIQHGLELDQITNSATTLRYDRPLESIATRTPYMPLCTICMFVANGEPFEDVSEAFQTILQQIAPGTPVQFILEVYAGVGSTSEKLEAYRNMVVARMVSSAKGTNVYIRSNIIGSDQTNLDTIISDAMFGLSFAYWKESISPDHRVFVVNSKRELLRQGTFWDFMQQIHNISDLPLAAHLEQLPSHYTQLATTSEDDERATDKSRTYLTDSSPTVESRRQLFRRNPTTQVMQSLRRSGLSWLAVDNLTYGMRFSNATDWNDWSSIKDVTMIMCAVVPYAQTLSNDIHTIAKQIIVEVQTTLEPNRQHECMVCVTGEPHDSWDDLYDFQTKLLTTIQSHKVKVTLTSYIYRKLSGEKKRNYQKVLLAVAQYSHWLTNHYTTPRIVWHCSKT